MNLSRSVRWRTLRAREEPDAGFNAGGTADSEDDIRPGIRMYSGTVLFLPAIRPGKKRRKTAWII